MEQITFQINNLPLNLTLLSNGCIALSPNQQFHTIIEQPENGISAIYDMDGLTIDSELELEYNSMTEYKHIPKLLQWLQQQGIEKPNVQRGF